MRSPQQLTLPIAGASYNPVETESVRRVLERGYEDLRNDIIGNRDTTYKPATLTMRRHQFLLMGA
jgi:hypothetical protein